MKRFPLDKNYATLLSGQNISVSEIMRRAKLPEDLFSRKDTSLTTEEYLRFMESIGESVKGTDLPIRLATAEQIETINPPIFAAYCSQDAAHCMKRLARYKALAGAVSFQVIEEEGSIGVEMTASETGEELPRIIVGIEMVLMLNLIRKATKKQIVPVKVTVRHPFANPIYEEFMGCKIEEGNEDGIFFSDRDAEIPFITRNDTMWEFFKPELKKSLSEMEVDDSFSARVRSTLVELIPGGQSAIEDVAEKLGMSKRTLQRKLSEEKTTFQKQLNHTRELMAKNYLQNTELSSEDIAFLLGYQDVSSFFRAFSLWTGQGVSEYKNSIKAHRRSGANCLFDIKSI